MKQILLSSLLALAVLSVSVTSCTKDEDGGNGGGSDTSFTKKVVVEDLTGAWCGFCPRVAYALETYKTGNANGSNLIMVGVHGGSSGSDPYKFTNYQSYLSKYGISGYPSAIMNRNTEWNESAQELDNEFGTTGKASLGMKISSSVSPNQLGENFITGNVKVKFGANMNDRNLKLVVLLVENGLVYPQVNYYSNGYSYTPKLYGGVSPITNFVHNGVLRKTATDLWGDVIPAEQKSKGNEYSYDFNMSLNGTTFTGTSYSADKTKVGIVTIVVDETDPSNIVALNAQYADGGTTKNYD